MKKLRILFAVIVSMIMVGCSENIPQGYIDSDYIQNLARNGSVATFVKTGYEVYKKEAGSQNWEKIMPTDNPSDHCGWRSHYQSTLSFQDGRLWRPVDLTSHPSKGTLLMDLAWRAYCKATNEKRSLYIAPLFEYDEQNKKFYIEKDVYDVLEFTEDKLVLSYDEPYWVASDDGSDGLIYGGTHREIATFQKGETVRFNSGDIVQFDNMIDCYHYILDKAHEKFGDVIDLNQVFYPNIIYEQPYINLKDLEAWVNEQEQK